ncbi:MAG: DUF424 family protein [Candidatus Micrarchaeia archaeon]
MIYVKRHVTPSGNILAMCDENQIGKVLKDGEIIINLKDYADFYKGELIKSASEKLQDIYAQDIYSANIVGEEAVELAIKSNIVSKENVKKASGVPYAHAYRIE